MHDALMSERISQALWCATDSLRGVAEPMLTKDLVLVMVFWKYISDCEADLTASGGASDQASHLLVPARASFHTLRRQIHESEPAKRIHAAFAQIEAANGAKWGGVLQHLRVDAPWLGTQDSQDTVLRKLMHIFDTPDLDFRPSQLEANVLSCAAELYVGYVATQSAKNADEFHTATELCELMSALMAPKVGEDICDPACGLGFLLLKCGQQVQRSGGGHDYRLFGQDKNGVNAALAHLILYMSGERDFELQQGDTLRQPMLLDRHGSLQTFDVVVSNPPFSLQHWGHDQASRDAFSRFSRGVPPPSKGDYAFISHMVSTLKPGTGRMAVLVPHGVLFRGAAEGQIRRKLIEEGLVDAVIGLPPKLLHSSAIPMALLVLRKQKADDKVLFMDASRDFTPGKAVNGLAAEHIDRLVDAYQSRHSVPGWAHLATPEEIASHDHSLHIPKYVQPAMHCDEIDIHAVRAERQQLQMELVSLEAALARCLREADHA
jgi:type I restriction enzyme M protein